MSLLVFPLGMMGQSAREEIRQNPDLAAGKYYAYREPQTRLTPAPSGYEPFYISSFARHGSRYLTKEKKYSQPLNLLLEADDEGVLTSDGKRALKVVALLAQEAEGRYGELTPKGAEQHRKLVDRMYANYPQVFQNGVHVDARSTYKTRAFLSMAAACVELKGLNPELHITTEASEHDAYYIKYKNPLYEAQHLEDIDSVYFIDNDDYFHKKFIYTDNEGNFLEDNDERAIFFARGILETVKKLRWKPDIVHCSGWISHLLPLYLKKAFKNDPIFADAKVVLSLYDEYMDSKFNPDMKSKIPVSGIKSKDLDAFKASDGINLAKLAIQYADAVILGSENIRPELMEFSASRGIPVLEYFPIDHPEGTYIQKFNEFYDKLLE